MSRTDLLRQLLKLDVRLILLGASFLLFATAGNLREFLEIFTKEMTNPKTVVPICSAMGAAYVLRLTGCDQHLVTLLLWPLRKGRALLLPGGIVAAYLVNTAMVSQSSTAATVGLVLIPLLLGAGYSAQVAGAALLLGASMGGEQWNPGAVEIATLASLTHVSPDQVVRKVAPQNLTACVVALLAFCLLTLRETRSASSSSQAPERPGAPSLNLAKALTPLVPLVLLFVLPRYGPFAALPGHIQILSAMLVGVLLSTLLSPNLVGKIPGEFFAGTGYAYTQVISLILTATLFTEGLKAHGVIEVLARGLSIHKSLALLCSVVLPLFLAAFTGSGIAPAVAVMKVLCPLAPSLGLDPLRLGGLISVSAQLGRTMSPAAAVAMMSASVSGTQVPELVRRVAPPLCLGALVLLGAALVGLL